MPSILTQWILLTASNFLLVLYLTDVSVKGPLNIFERIRSIAGIEPVVEYNIETEESILVGSKVSDKFFAQLLDCPRCASPWLAGLLIIISWAVGFLVPDWSALVLWLAVSGATVLTFELID